MTGTRRNAGALLRAAAVATIAAGCASTNAAVDPSWTEKPSGASADDAGADASADATGSADADAGDARIDPPEVLCVLRGPPASTPGDTLVYGEEFSGSAVDTTRWTPGIGKRGPSDVLNRTSPADLSVHDGSLFVTAEHAPADPTYPYVTGYMETLGKYARTYGKVEFRARFPYAAGVWYAMWGRAWFESFPEIDIEILNTAAVTHSQLYFVNHWAAPPIPADLRRKYVKLDDIDVSVFHTYTVTWTPGLLEWAIDGVTKMQSNGPGVPTKPVYWIINAWVGGWAGPPPVTTVMPVTFEVDSMRVYRVDGLIGDPALQIVNPASSYTRKSAIQLAIANFDEACAHVEMYDGDTRVRTTSLAPYSFSLARLTPGPHKLTFAVTDGVRRTTTEIDTQIQ